MNHFDHSGHEGMDHGMPDMDHGGHGGMDMSGQCSMNMIWYANVRRVIASYLLIFVPQEYADNRHLHCLPSVAVSLTLLSSIEPPH